jgi:hypothetical protein
MDYYAALVRSRMGRTPPEPGWSEPMPWSGESHWVSGWDKMACHGLNDQPVIYYQGPRHPDVPDSARPCTDCLAHAR